MGVFGSILAATVVGALLYAGDRGVAFNVCAYFSIASGGKFNAEEAFHETDNSFFRPIKLLPSAALVIATFVFALQGGVHDTWKIGVMVAIAVWYTAAITFAAITAFRRTKFNEYFKV